MKEKIKCPNCKLLIDDDSITCPYCGYKLEEEDIAKQKEEKVSINYKKIRKREYTTPFHTQAGIRLYRRRGHPLRRKG